MLAKDSAAGVTQKLESFTGKYASDNQGYASPPTSQEWPRFRTLTGADIPAVIAAVNGYGIAAQNSTSSLTTRFMSLTSFTGTIATVAATSTTPVANSFATIVTANNSAGLAEAFVGSRCLGNLKSVKYSLKLEQTANMRIWIGVTSVTTAATFKSDTPNANFVGFRYSTAAGDTNYQCVTQTSNVNSTKNAASPAVSIDTNPHIFEIQYDGTNAVFFVDGVQVGSQSGNIPANSVGLAHMIFIDNVNLGNIVKFDLYSLTGVDYPTG